LPASGAWRQLADQERFYSPAHHAALAPVESTLTVPALGCRLWVDGESV